MHHSSNSTTASSELRKSLEATRSIRLKMELVGIQQLWIKIKWYQFSSPSTKGEQHHSTWVFYTIIITLVFKCCLIPIFSQMCQKIDFRFLGVCLQVSPLKTWDDKSYLLNTSEVSNCYLLPVTHVAKICRYCLSSVMTQMFKTFDCIVL